jgi:hypothetical protein
LDLESPYYISGVHSTLGSRSFTKLYEPQKETAATIKTLIDQGAIIVWKTKLGACAGSGVPPEKCIDYFSPGILEVMVSGLFGQFQWRRLKHG